jgi:hypothetical protein
MKKYNIAALAILVFIVSCKKEDSTAAAETVKYMSFTAGSNWTYRYKNNISGSSVDYTTTSTNRDSTVSGRVYHVFTNSNGGGNQYYNITGNDYYTFYNLAATPISDRIESIYLKDNAAVNTSWSQSYTITNSGVPITIKITNTIAEKGISKTVNAIAYTDVIHVSSVLSASVLGIPLPQDAITSDIQLYYAKKFGMIESKNKISIDYNGIVSDTDDETILISADIK